MDKIEGLFVVVQEFYGAYEVEGPFVYEVALEYWNMFTM